MPDTDRGKSLVNYDLIIEYVRNAPWLSAIIIMVEDTKWHGRAYRDMRALLKQFNMLPCSKIMVFG